MDKILRNDLFLIKYLHSTSGTSRRRALETGEVEVLAVWVQAGSVSVGKVLLRVTRRGRLQDSFHKTRDLSVTARGDESTCGGLQEDLVWLKELMESWFEIKFRGFLGLDAGDVQEISILGGIVRVNGEGVEYEADPKHRRLVMEHFGVKEGSKNVKKQWRPR